LQLALLVARHPIDHALAIIFLLKGMSSAMTFGKPVSGPRENEQLYSVKISAKPMKSLGTSEDFDPEAHQCVALRLTFHDNGLDSIKEFLCTH